jgi:hypothetical protein
MHAIEHVYEYVSLLDILSAMPSHLLQPASLASPRVVHARLNKLTPASSFFSIQSMGCRIRREALRTRLVAQSSQRRIQKGLFSSFFFVTLLDAWIWLAVEDGEVSVVGGRVADRLASEDGGLMESQGDVGCVVCCVQRHVHVEERERRRGLP